MTLLAEGVETGALRPDIDVTLTYRFIRDTVWVAVKWYRPGKGHTHEQIADQYLTILLDGIAHACSERGLHRRRRPHPGRQARGSAGARCTRPTSPRTRWRR